MEKKHKNYENNSELWNTVNTKNLESDKRSLSTDGFYMYL